MISSTKASQEKTLHSQNTEFFPIGKKRLYELTDENEILESLSQSIQRC
jgi:hypothetical protein